MLPLAADRQFLWRGATVNGDAARLPAWAEFESGTLPVAVLVVWCHEGGWHAGTVLHRTGGGPVMAHAPWQEPFLGAPPGSLAKLWDYLAERVREGHGGNAYSHEIEAFEVAHRSHIAPLVTAPPRRSS